MIKKSLAILLSVVMFISAFSGCSEKDEGLYFGDEITKDTLRICVDVWRTDPLFNSNSLKETKALFEDLSAKLKEECNIEKISFEILPQYDETQRKLKLQRLHTEIMAGKGPDLFIAQCGFSGLASYRGKGIFAYPEKSMEVGLFLPLDEYMENSTQFTDWNAQTQSVLNAGQSDEGQVLIPITYKIPMMIYPEEKVNIPYTQNLTRREILDNHETSDIGAVIYTAIGKALTDGTGWIPYKAAVLDSLGKYADYENEELLFTEDELYSIANEAFKLREVMNSNEWISYEWSNSLFSDSYHALRSSDTEKCLVPRYTKDGGIAAQITAFMAVNRSSKHPEKAFSVIDYLMQEDVQRYNELYHEYFCDGYPLQNDLGSEEKAFGDDDLCTSFSQKHMKELLSIKEQITAVNIIGELDSIMEDMMLDLIYCMADTEYSADIPREVVSEAYEKMAQAMKE